MSVTTPNRFCDYYIDKAINTLFESESKRVNKWMLSLCQEHSSVTGTDCYGFKYKGERYIPEEYSNFMKKVRELPTLSINLSQKVIDFYTEVQRIKKDRDQIRQLFALLLMKSTTVFEVRNALPECVVALVGLQNDSVRSIPEGANLSPTAKEQYDRLLPKIQMYSVIHLINS